VKNILEDILMVLVGVKKIPLGGEYILKGKNPPKKCD